MAYELLLVSAAVGSVLALVPGLVFLIYVARRSGRLWVVAVLGGVFWLLALLARLPVVVPLQLLPILLPAWWASLPLSVKAVAVWVIFFVSSLCAGVFEEGFKYLLMRFRPSFIKTPRHVLSLGLGWGFAEAFLMTGLGYVAIIAFLPLVAPFLGPEVEVAMSLLAGGVERNSAIVVHVSLSVFVAMALWYAQRKWLWSAMLLHCAFNFIILWTVYGLVYPILGATALTVALAEALVAVEAVVVALLAYRLWRSKGGPPKAST